MPYHKNILGKGSRSLCSETTNQNTKPESMHWPETLGGHLTAPPLAFKAQHELPSASGTDASEKSGGKYSWKSQHLTVSLKTWLRLSSEAFGEKRCARDCVNTKLADCWPRCPTEMHALAKGIELTSVSD